MLVGALAAPAGASAQTVPCDDGAREVRGLTFVGNRTFPDRILADGILTTPSAWPRRWFRVVGARRCLDPAAFREDVIRLIIFYRNHGFVRVTVDTVVRPAGRDAVAITFRIAEGRPVRVDTLALPGLSAVPESAQVTRRLPVVAGGRFDKYGIDAARDTMTRRLRNVGYPLARVFRSWSSDTAADRAVVELATDAGPRARVGAVTVEVTPREGTDQRISQRTVRRLVGVRPGDLYRDDALRDAKRTLFLTDAYAAVDVALDTTSLSAGDSLVGVRVRVAEGAMRSAQVGGGYGTLDCLRARGQLADVDFLNSARRLVVSGRVSKIGIGRPFGGAAALCPQIRDDPFSRELNYYVGATVTQVGGFASTWQPAVTVFSERRSEFNAFLRSVPIGAVASVTRAGGDRVTHTVSYGLELGRTEASPATFCVANSVCDAADRAALTELLRLAVLSYSVVRDRSDDPFNPTRGTVLRAEVRQAARALGSDRRLEFSKLLLDGTAYLPGGGGNVLAIRLRGARAFGPWFQGTARYIPPDERLYSGGPTTVRGYLQNELGPTAYVADAYDTVRVAPDTVFFRARPGSVSNRPVPSGGDATVVGNVEYRLRSPVLTDLLQWTVFGDVGEVWRFGSDDPSSRFRGVRMTPGLGVRVATPVGVFRMDLAYNPYDRRPGAAYFDTPLTQGGQLYCVSPTNTLPVEGVDRAELPAVQAAGRCPADFQPPRGSRLRFAFAFGQAF